jgi:hypothetical protein
VVALAFEEGGFLLALLLALAPLALTPRAVLFGPVPTTSFSLFGFAPLAFAPFLGLSQAQHALARASLLLASPAPDRGLLGVGRDADSRREQVVT